MIFGIIIRTFRQQVLICHIFESSAEIRRKFGGNSAEIRPKFGGNFGGNSAEWVAGSAEWVAGSAVKLGIFSDFWRGASARAKNRKKCFKKFGGISAEMAAENSAKIPQIQKLLRKLLGIGSK